MNLKSQQDPAVLLAVQARHVPHTEDHGRLVSASVRKESVRGVPQFSNITGLVKLTREPLIGARLQAVGLKAARLKAARLKAVMGFPDKLKAVSRGVRKPDLT